MPASLEMLTAAAESAARTSEFPSSNDSNSNLVAKVAVLDVALGSPANTNIAESAPIDPSFEQELSEFLGIGSYGMMDVWAPLDDGLRTW